MHRCSKISGSLIGAVLSFVLVTGCASATDYPLALSTKLQASVQLVMQLSSDGKYNAALTALETLRGDLADAREDGSVSGERVKEIEAAIGVVGVGAGSAGVNRAAAVVDQP